MPAIRSPPTTHRQPFAHPDEYDDDVDTRDDPTRPRGQSEDVIGNKSGTRLRGSSNDVIESTHATRPRGSSNDVIGSTHATRPRGSSNDVIENTRATRPLSNDITSTRRGLMVGRSEPVNEDERRSSFDRRDRGDFNGIYGEDKINTTFGRQDREDSERTGRDDKKGLSVDGHDRGDLEREFNRDKIKMTFDGQDRGKFQRNNRGDERRKDVVDYEDRENFAANRMPSRKVMDRPIKVLVDLPTKVWELEGEVSGLQAKLDHERRVFFEEREDFEKERQRATKEREEDQLENELIKRQTEDIIAEREQLVKEQYEEKIKSLIATQKAALVSAREAVEENTKSLNEEKNVFQLEIDELREQIETEREKVIQGRKRHEQETTEWRREIESLTSELDDNLRREQEVNEFHAKTLKTQQAEFQAREQVMERTHSMALIEAKTSVLERAKQSVLEQAKSTALEHAKMAALEASNAKSSTAASSNINNTSVKELQEHLARMTAQNEGLRASLFREREQSAYDEHRFAIDVEMAQQRTDEAVARALSVVRKAEEHVAQATRGMMLVNGSVAKNEKQQRRESTQSVLQSRMVRSTSQSDLFLNPSSAKVAAPPPPPTRSASPVVRRAPSPSYLQHTQSSAYRLRRHIAGESFGNW